MGSGTAPVPGAGETEPGSDGAGPAPQPGSARGAPNRTRNPKTAEAAKEGLVNRNMGEGYRLAAVCRGKLLGEFLPRLEAAVARLPDDELWRRPNEASNSVGNLLLHLEGNVRQWIVAGLGGAPDTRTRRREFETRGPLPRQQLLDALRRTVEEADRVVAGLDPRELRRVRRIQAYEVDGVEILVHVVEHFSYHLGQIAYAVKAARNEDLGFYAGVPLDAAGAAPPPK